jgi:serine/threonine protein kinase
MVMQVEQIDQLAGRKLGAYQVERLLGQGQLSAVYLARRGKQSDVVLLTVFLLPQSIPAPERKQLIADFMQNGATLVRLQHPHILPTYDFGEQGEYPYLVTAFARGASLAQLLKQQGRLTPEQTLPILKQLAEGLDYAHNNGIVHGLLGLSNVLVSSDMSAQIAGFGLKIMLAKHGQRQAGRAQSHLLNASGAFLGSPDYISPECVLGAPVGASSDIYALGVMLFELLSGAPPFHGTTPLETALQRVQQPVPLLHAISPDIPEGFDLVIGKALSREPSSRYRQAGELAKSFERVFRMLDAAPQLSSIMTQPAARQAQLTMPPSVNWFEEDVSMTGKWQLKPPIVTGQVPSVSPNAPTEAMSRQAAFTQQSQVTGDSLANLPGHGAPSSSKLQNSLNSFRERFESIAGIDPFAWWSVSSEKETTAEPGTFMRRPLRKAVRLSSDHKPVREDRRQAIRLIATGAVVTGVFVAGGISFEKFVQSLKGAQAGTSTYTSTTSSGTQSSAPTTGATGAPTNSTAVAKTPGAKPSPTKSAHPSPTAGATQQPTSQPTGQPTSQPTSQPTPKPTPPPPSPTPSHTGTVIGSTSMATNSAATFTNPADGNTGLLIHLANGNFVACENACTHAGVPVNYNSGQQKLVCPAHGAVFDPASGFSQVPGQGPSGLRPLAGVTIRVNSDGTITTG